ncbi:MAG: DUF4159 domain-containing protein [Gammaproteobacteria bacterium]|jgi:hypothetical protein
MPASRGKLLACRSTAVALIVSLLIAAGAWAQRAFRVYPSFEGASTEAPLPADWDVPGELVIGRLMYPSGSFGFGGDWRQGNTGWTDDYPKGDRKLIEMIRRFTRTNVRGVEQPINLEDRGDVFYYPFIIVGLARAWQLTDQMAADLREYLLRGGFLFCDSFFGSRNLAVFEEGLNRVFPDRPIVELSAEEAVFHSVFNLPQMIDTQIPNAGAVLRGSYGFMGRDGAKPNWRGVFDDEGRLMVLIAHNNDVADAWQWADDPRYPADKANLALRFGANVVMYSMTH